MAEDENQADELMRKVRSCRLAALIAGRNRQADEFRRRVLNDRRGAAQAKRERKRLRAQQLRERNAANALAGVDRNS